MSRRVEVVIDLHRAYEVWTVEVPDEVADENVDYWVEENFFNTADRTREESGHDGCSIANIAIL